MAAFLNSGHLGFNHLSFTSHTHSHLPRMVATICTKKLTHSCLPTICTKKLHSFILTQTWWWQPSWILPCWIQTLPFWIQTLLLSSLRFTQKHSHSNLTLNQTNSIWLKLIHSHVTWCWQPSWILLSWIQLFHTKKLHLLILTQLDDGIHLEFYHLEFNHAILDSTILIWQNLIETNSIWLKLIHSLSTWWWQPSWTLPSWINPFCTAKHSHLWLKLIQSDSNSFILT